MNSKQTIKLVLVVASATLLQSCTSLSKFSSAKTIDIATAISQKPTLADLDVRDKKVTATASFKKKEKGVEAAKIEAVAMALKTVNADILVEPQFETEITTYTITVTATGYPGFYKNFRNLKAEDVALLKSLLGNETSNLPASGTLNYTLNQK